MAGGVGCSEGLEHGEVTPTTAKKWDTHKMWRQKTDNKTLSFVLSGLIRGLWSHLGALPLRCLETLQGRRDACVSSVGLGWDLKVWTRRTALNSSLASTCLTPIQQRAKRCHSVYSEEQRAVLEKDVHMGKG